MKPLYEITGKIEDINTVLVPRQELDGLTKAARQALGVLSELAEWESEGDPRHPASVAITALREALEAAPQPAAVGQEPVVWQPIGTAPNGKIVLVHYKNRLGNGRTMRARYYLSETLESDNTESGWADEGWYEESEAYEYLMPLDGTPTHWMPLPSAPDASAPQPARQPLTDKQIASACLSYRHDFGLLPKQKQESIIFQAREWERALGKEREIGGDA